MSYMQVLGRKLNTEKAEHINQWKWLQGTRLHCEKRRKRSTNQWVENGSQERDLIVRETGRDQPEEATDGNKT